MLRVCSHNRVDYQETNDETRKRIAEHLKQSTAMYADHAENKISKLQQAYLKKYATEASQRPEDVWNKKFGVSALFRGRREYLRESEPAKPSTFEEGIPDFMGSDLVYLLNQCPTTIVGWPLADSTAFD